MKILKGYTLIRDEDLDKKIEKAEARGKEWGKAGVKSRLDELKTSDARKTKEIAKLKEQIEDKDEAIKVYEEKRDAAREVIKQGIENDDLKSVLDARKEAQDKREARLKDKLTEVEAAESAVAKNAYADGLADGLRKAHEITGKDRENAMKIAMVSAASHSTPENVKQATNALQLTSGKE